jgi:hypothetical protein
MKIYNGEGDRPQMELEWKWTSYNFECTKMKGNHRKFIEEILTSLLQSMSLLHYALPPKLKWMDWTSPKPLHLHWIHQVVAISKPLPL